MSFSLEQNKPTKTEDTYPSWLPDGYHPDHQILDHCPFLRSEKARNCIPLFSESNPIVVALKTARLSQVFTAISIDLEKKKQDNQRRRLAKNYLKTHIINIFGLILEIKKETGTVFPSALIRSLRDVLYDCLLFEAKTTYGGSRKSQLRTEILFDRRIGYLSLEMSQTLLAEVDK